MKYVLVAFLFSISCCMMAQNSSFGVGIGSVNLMNSSGLHFTGNVRTQFTNTLGWQTEVGYLALDEVYNGFIFGTKAMSVKTAITAKLFNRNGFSVETIVGGGLFKDGRDHFGLLSGELFLSSQISEHITAGIPISYNFVTWARLEYYTAGISLRFHM